MTGDIARPAISTLSTLSRALDFANVADILDTAAMADMVNPLDVRVPYEQNISFAKNVSALGLGKAVAFEILRMTQGAGRKRLL